MTTETFSFFFAVLSLCCAGATVLVVAGAVIRRLNPAAHRFEILVDDLSRVAIGLAALVAVVAMAGSLYLSEVAKFVPCPLCWYQRICMYPLALVLTIAAVRRDLRIWVYGFALAAAGTVIAIYHTWIQAFPPANGSTFCTTEAPCTERYVWQFGFVSIPFMALTGFLFIITMMLVARATLRRADADLPPTDGHRAPTD